MRLCTNSDIISHNFQFWPLTWLFLMFVVSLCLESRDHSEQTSVSPMHTEHIAAHLRTLAPISLGDCYHGDKRVWQWTALSVFLSTRCPLNGTAACCWNACWEEKQLLSLAGISWCQMSDMLFTSSWRCKSATGQSQVREEQHLTPFTVPQVSLPSVLCSVKTDLFSLYLPPVPSSSSVHLSFLPLLLLSFFPSLPLIGHWSVVSVSHVSFLPGWLSEWVCNRKWHHQLTGVFVPGMWAAPGVNSSTEKIPETNKHIKFCFVPNEITHLWNLLILMLILTKHLNNGI